MCTYAESPLTYGKTTIDKYIHLTDITSTDATTTLSLTRGGPTSIQWYSSEYPRILAEN
jgi:hypothetical protein